MMMIVLCRDKGSGTVTIDQDGEPLLHYPVATHDRRTIMDGLEACIRVMATAGAVAVATGQHSLPDLTWLPEAGAQATDEELQQRDEAIETLIAQVRQAGIDPRFRHPLFSAHQMGTCRMGTEASNSVVDPNGQVWGVRGLYVADTSVFPTSSGANPMVTTLAIAHCIAQDLKCVLKKEL